jgi:protease I
LLSADTGVAVSTGRIILTPDLTLDRLDHTGFAALVLVGGPGMVLYWDDSLLHERCRDFAEAGKPVAAVGIAPITLARSGILKGRTATVHNDRSTKSGFDSLGVRFSFRGLVVDRNIITANGPDRAGDLARAVVRAVTGRQK